MGSEVQDCAVDDGIEAKFKSKSLKASELGVASGLDVERAATRIRLFDAGRKTGVGFAGARARHDTAGGTAVQIAIESIAEIAQSPIHFAERNGMPAFARAGGQFIEKRRRHERCPGASSSSGRIQVSRRLRADASSMV